MQSIDARINSKILGKFFLGIHLLYSEFCFTPNTLAISLSLPTFYRFFTSASFFISISSRQTYDYFDYFIFV